MKCERGDELSALAPKQQLDLLVERFDHRETAD
jgi:hypothetical protein